MKPEKQRIAILVELGWKPTGVHWGNSVPTFWKQGEDTHMLTDLPDPINDLNAMHEAWKSLNPDQKGTYRSELSVIAVRESIRRDECWLEDIAAEFGPEAFLRTIGKWEESE